MHDEAGDYVLLLILPTYKSLFVFPPSLFEVPLYYPPTLEQPRAFPVLFLELLLPTEQIIIICVPCTAQVDLVGHTLGNHHPRLTDKLECKASRLLAVARKIQINFESPRTSQNRFRDTDLGHN